MPDDTELITAAVAMRTLNLRNVDAVYALDDLLEPVRADDGRDGMRLYRRDVVERHAGARAARQDGDQPSTPSQYRLDDAEDRARLDAQDRNAAFVYRAAADESRELGDSAGAARWDALAADTEASITKRAAKARVDAAERERVLDRLDELGAKLTEAQRARSVDYLRSALATMERLTADDDMRRSDAAALAAPPTARELYVARQRLATGGTTTTPEELIRRDRQRRLEHERTIAETGERADELDVDAAHQRMRDRNRGAGAAPLKARDDNEEKEDALGDDPDAASVAEASKPAWQKMIERNRAAGTAALSKRADDGKIEPLGVATTTGKPRKRAAKRPK